MANKFNTKFEVNDLTKYYKTSPPLEVVLKNSNGRTLANKPVTITIHGVTYNRTTNANGYCKLDINLEPGTYPTVVAWAGDVGYNGTSKKHSRFRTYTAGQQRQTAQKKLSPKRPCPDYAL